MKRIIYLLILLLLTVGANAQTTIKKEATNDFNNQFNIGLEVLATNFSYTRRVSNNIRIGAGLGFGYSLVFGMKKDEIELKDGALEMYHMSIVVGCRLKKSLNYESKLGIIGVTGNDFSPPMAIGITNGLFFRIRKIELGVQVVVGREIYEDSNKWLYYIKPLQLKIPIQW